MQWWANIWLVVLVAGFLLFASISLVVSILGFRDMRLMFRSIMQQHEANESSESESPAAE